MRRDGGKVNVGDSAVANFIKKGEWNMFSLLKVSTRLHQAVIFKKACTLNNYGYF